METKHKINFYEDTCILIREKIDADIVWERWDPNKRTDFDNQNYDFIKFKGDDMSKTVVMKVMDLQDIGKTTDDIAWIAKIPEFFKNFDFIN